MTDMIPVATTTPPRTDLIRDIAAQISAANGLDDTVELLVDHLARVFDADECHLFLIDGERVTKVASHGITAPLPDHSVQELRSGLTGWALDRMRAASTLDTVLDDRNTGLARYRAEIVGPRSCIVVPIPGSNGPIGTITLLAAPSLLDPDAGQLEELERVGAIAGAAIAHARLREDERSARIDAEHQQRVARRLAQERDHTIAVIAHELRNALTTSSGALELLLEDGAFDLDDEIRGLVELAAVSAADAVNIVARLLRPSVDDGGPGSVDVAQLAVNAARATGVTFSGIASGVESNCPAVHVRQILRNLIMNAQIHGGAHIGVDVECRDGSAVITVVDDGPGVGPGMTETIFQPYVTTGDTTGPRPSSGLGLAISRQLARQAGGDLSYLRVDNQTRFELSLPVS